MLDSLFGPIRSGAAQLGRALQEFTEPVEKRIEAGEENATAAARGLKVEAELVPELLKQLANLNTNLAGLIDVLAPVVAVEHSVENAEHRLHSLLPHHHEPPQS